VPTSGRILTCQLNAIISVKKIKWDRERILTNPSDSLASPSAFQPYS
jgi:hypothetical protein